MKKFTNNINSLPRNLRLWNEVLEQKSRLAVIKKRSVIVSFFILFCFFLLAFRMFNIILFSEADFKAKLSDHCKKERAQILDKSGNTISISIPTASIYANPRQISKHNKTAKELSKIFPSINSKKLLKQFNTKSNFVWVKRHVSPKEQEKFLRAGLPGVYIQEDKKRFYPYGALFSHVLGCCDIDEVGISGMEKFFNGLESRDSNNLVLKLSLDLKVQHAVRQELLDAQKEFQATASNAIIMEIKTGRIIAMVSLPDFNPNVFESMNKENSFNINSLGVYEIGSVFKIINTAIALETNTSNFGSFYDARAPLKMGRFKITDFCAKNRILSFTESFFYSSNIANVLMAKKFGKDVQKEYFGKFNLLNPISIELPEVGKPILPRDWSDSAMTTISYGYGFSVSPLHFLTVVNAIINDGVWVQPTLCINSPNYDCKINKKNIKPINKRIISSRVSNALKYLMRINVSCGSGKKAEIKGYEVFGKTGTANRAQKGRYNKTSRITVFVGGFPYNNPIYSFIVMLHDPKSTKNSYGFAAGGWNVAPLTGKIISRIAPMLGVPVKEEKNGDFINLSTISSKKF